MSETPHDSRNLDALIVGAGPTGLTLAAQLHLYGLRLRLVDRLADRGRESRALAVQARSLEIFQSLGLADTLVSRGRTAVRFVIHLDDRSTVDVRLGDVDAADTRFPFILFVSQAETEAVLNEHLRSNGVTIERGVELTHAHPEPQGVTCTLRHADGREEQVRTRFLLGCDGAHSFVRKLAGIPFEGDAYPQNFLLGDLDADGPLSGDAINAFPGESGFAIFFPLGEPRAWRVIGMSPGEPERERDEAGNDPSTMEGLLEKLQAIVDSATSRSVRLRNPAWVTPFRLHHRQARHYRAGALFLAGDAAHIHSPVGGQGMNTGIQDAWNLGWKLALVARGAANPALLDSYQAERWPIGRFLLRVTDRAFTVITRVAAAAGPAARIRRALAPVIPKVVSPLLASRQLRTTAFRFVSELDLRYRESPIVQEGEPHLRSGPRAGDRCPDGAVTRDGRATTLLQVLTGPSLHLLLCGGGSSHRWDDEACAGLSSRRDGLIRLHRLTRQPSPGAPGTLIDETGGLLSRLGVGVDDAAQYLIRPDGYIAYRCAGHDLRGVTDYLARWFTTPAPS